MPNPKWKTEVAIRTGTAILELACRNRAEIEPRLEAGALDGMKANVEALRSKTSAAAQLKQEQQTATQTQIKARANAAKRASAVRESMRSAFPGDDELLTAFGVGVPAHTSSVGSVAKIAEIVIKAAGSNSERVREASVLPADIDKLREDLQALLDADAAQESKKIGAKEATTARNAAQLRVERDIALVLNAARLAFVGKPEVVRAFEELIPSKGRSAKAKKTASEAAPAKS